MYFRDTLKLFGNKETSESYSINFHENYEFGGENAENPFQ